MIMKATLLNPETVEFQLGFSQNDLLRFYESRYISELYGLFYRNIHEIPSKFFDGRGFEIYWRLLERIQNDIQGSKVLNEKYKIPVRDPRSSVSIESSVHNFVLNPLLWQALGIRGQARRSYNLLQEIQEELGQVYATSLLTEFVLIEQLRGSLDVTLMRVHAEANLSKTPFGKKIHSDQWSSYASVKDYERFVRYLMKHPKRNVVPYTENTIPQFTRNWQRIQELDEFYQTQARVDGFDYERRNFYALLNQFFCKRE